MSKQPPGVIGAGTVRALLRDVAVGVLTLAEAEALVDEIVAPPPLAPELPGQLAAICPDGGVLT